MVDDHELRARHGDLFHTLPESKRTGAADWPGKTVTTFSDALASVRRWLRAESLLPQAGQTMVL